MSVVDNSLKWGYAGTVVLFVLVTMTLTACSEPPKAHRTATRSPRRPTEANLNLLGANLKRSPRARSAKLTRPRSKYPLMNGPPLRPCGPITRRRPAATRGGKRCSAK
jgi:hypothetical protein